MRSSAKTVMMSASLFQAGLTHSAASNFHLSLWMCEDILVGFSDSRCYRNVGEKKKSDQVQSRNTFLFWSFPPFCRRHCRESWKQTALITTSGFMGLHLQGVHMVLWEHSQRESLCVSYCSLRWLDCSCVYEDVSMFFFWSSHTACGELLNLFRPHSAVCRLKVISHGPIIQLHPPCTFTLFFFFFFKHSLANEMWQRSRERSTCTY